MRKLLSQLPSDAVEQVNAKIPRDKDTGEPKFPENVADNGYVNQYFLTLWEKMDKLAVCERLKKQGSPHVGEATVFVSWFLKTPLKTLIDALREFLRQKQLPLDTKFWVCDFVIRQATRQLAAADNDVKRLGDCVRAVGHTVLLLEPWDAPAPLKRAYCIKEVYYTQKSGAQFDVVMASAQQTAFEAALVEDFDSVRASLSQVNVRNAECLKVEETKVILEELDREVGLVECNTLVIGLLREALAAQARAALVRLPVAERGTSALLICLGMLLHTMGQLEEAKPLLVEALKARKEMLGDRHRDTLVSIAQLGWLLKDMGQLEQARSLLEEVLQARRETLDDRHRDTLISISNMGALLIEMGQLEEARPLLKEALQARRETLSDRDPKTLSSISYMGVLLKEMGHLEEARPLLKEALQARRETLGNRDDKTLSSISYMGMLMLAMGELEEARPLLEEALQAQRETLGDRHPSTLVSINNMAQLLQAMGKLEEAAPYLEEAVQGLQASREALGDRHPSTLTSLNNMSILLKEMGQLEEAKPLLKEAVQASKETLGDHHPKTLDLIGNMVDLLRSSGSLAEAELVLGNTKAVAQEVLGDHHVTTLKISAIAARLQHAQPGGAAAGMELLAATVAHMAEVLGESHPQACKYRKVLEEM